MGLFKTFSCRGLTYFFRVFVRRLFLPATPTTPGGAFGALLAIIFTFVMCNNFACGMNHLFLKLYREIKQEAGANNHSQKFYQKTRREINTMKSK